MTVKLAFVGMLALATACSPASETRTRQRTSYADLVALFHDWRTFEQPKIVDGAPDYSVAAMTAQHAELARYQRRL
ncbi:MAG TPA: hypothetical protein VN650_07280, partial [Gemmatimonadaceae bacterium]|nr:hypothetical protein [Gemmatimonadaceae bacterium]